MNEAKRKCWDEQWRINESYDEVYQKNKDSQTGWGENKGGIAHSDATFNEGNSAHESPKIVFPEDDKDKEAEAAYNAFRNIVFSSDEYKEIQKDLLRLEKADEKFCIRMGKYIIKEAGGGNFSYNVTTGEFDINIDDHGDYSTDEKLAHELTHAGQYMDGKLGFDVIKTMVRQIAYDLRDEIEAYERQGLIGKTIPADKVTNYYPELKYYNTNLKIDMLEYQNPSYPFNYMIEQNMKYKEHNSVRFLYHGWENDIKIR